MHAFNWDLNLVLPTHFINLMFANGVLYSNEEGATPDLAFALKERCKKLYKLLVWNGV